ncbi:hypothetical protein SRABI106_04363 [Rahnella aquatilis]|nr:hypothetical protein SRABI106_04363 [Rahnella aquatilis]
MLSGLLPSPWLMVRVRVLSVVVAPSAVLLLDCVAETKDCAEASCVTETEYLPAAAPVPVVTLNADVLLDEAVVAP